MSHLKEISMNTVRSFMIALFAFLPFGLSVIATTSISVSSVQAADKKVRTSVTGAGKSKSEAESEAAKAARQISPSYTTVSRNTSGNNKNYVCTMVIEYIQK